MSHTTPRGGRGGTACNRRTASRPRQGAILIAVMVCLAVAGLMLATIVSRTLLTRKQLRHEAAFQQATWLCEAGLQKACQRLNTASQTADMLS